VQIKQIGQDQEPIDLSRQENVVSFMRNLGTWQQRMAEDAATMSLYEYADIVGQGLKAYVSVRGSK
jgi:hypothetical protein